MRTGTNIVSALMPGSWIPKAADAVQNFLKEQEYKDVMAKEAEKNEADRVKAESDNLLRMIADTNETIPYSPPQGDPAQRAQAEAEAENRSLLNRYPASISESPGYTSSQFSGTGDGVITNPVPTPNLQPYYSYDFQTTDFPAIAPIASEPAPVVAFPNTPPPGINPFGQASLAVTVYGPDGTEFGSPAAAIDAGVTNYSMSPPEGSGVQVGDVRQNPIFTTQLSDASNLNMTPLQKEQEERLQSLMDQNPDETTKTLSGETYPGVSDDDSNTDYSGLPNIVDKYFSAPAPTIAPVQMVNVTETYQGDDPNPPGGWTKVRIGRDDYKHIRTVSVPASQAGIGGGQGSSGGGYTVGGYAPGSQAAAAAASGTVGGYGPGTPGFNSRGGGEGPNGPEGRGDPGGDRGGWGRGGGYAHGGSVHKLANKYGFGGSVKTHYQTAGPVKLPTGYESLEEDPVLPQLASAPVVADQVVPKAVPGNERMANLQAMLDMYGPKHSAYAADLRTARASAKAENDAFAKMLATSMGSPEDEQSSKAEIYFRLAAAFGAPTKTGEFSENLGLVGKELGDYAKGKRATAREQRLLNLELQKLKVGSAKEELDTLRTLSAEEMKDKRAVATELIKDYIRSGEPQSAAGKQALDEGLKAGTPAYQARVAEIGNLNVERQMAQIAASLAGVQTAASNLAVSQANADLAKEKFKNLQTQQAKLSPAEVKLKVDAEDTLAQTDQALANLKKAYALNPNTFDGSVLDVAQRKLYEAAGSKDPKVVATRELENLLKKASLSQLKATFPGAISNDERAALDAVQGLEAKSKDERAVIMKNAFTALKSVSERHRRRLSEINQGVYRDTTPIDEGDK